MVHVENVSHDFAVSEDGARHFITKVNFVRGIIVNENGVPFMFSKSGGTLDQNAKDIRVEEEINNNVISKKTYMDPD